ncbi:hypothetical protein C8R46DRAFT_1135490 [Mycena filopes]|nr:hypothetical protein C8R46DRAFT_1135490 [Mycena filopes]
MLGNPTPSTNISALSPWILYLISSDMDSSCGQTQCVDSSSISLPRPPRPRTGVVARLRATTENSSSRAAALIPSTGRRRRRPPHNAPRVILLVPHVFCAMQHHEGNQIEHSDAPRLFCDRSPVVDVEWVIRVEAGPALLQQVCLHVAAVLVPAVEGTWLPPQLHSASFPETTVSISAIPHCHRICHVRPRAALDPALIRPSVLQAKRGRCIP